MAPKTQLPFPTEAMGDYLRVKAMDDSARQPPKVPKPTMAENANINNAKAAAETQEGQVGEYPDC